MKHAIKKEELYAYRNGELPDARRTRVAEHVMACGSCNRFLRLIRGGTADFRAPESIPLPAPFLATAKRKPARRRGTLPLTLAGAAIAVAAAAAHAFWGAAGALAR